VEEGETPALTGEDAERAFSALAYTDYGKGWKSRPSELDPSYSRLANGLMQFIAASKSESTVDPAWISSVNKILSFSGESEVLLQQLSLLPRDQITSEDWTTVFQGFVAKNSADSIARAAELYKEKGNEVTTSFQGIVASAFAQIGDLRSARQWIPEVNSNAKWVDANSAATILRACSKHGEQELGKEIVRKAMEQPDVVKSREWWHAMLVWAAASNKKLNDIDQMMGVMARTNPGMEPNISTINELIEYANSIKSSILMENFLRLAAERKIRLDSTTFLLIIDNQLGCQDFPGAMATYERLMIDHSELVNSQELAVRINTLIQAACASPDADPMVITDLVEEQNHRDKRFDPDTVASLCIHYLRSDQYAAVVDLLRAHAPSFLISARKLVANRLVEFCLDRRNSIDRVWDTYVILHKTFDEVDRNIRTRIMVEFLTRRRADMAVHVFNHMRAHYRPDTILAGETYILALTGIGRVADPEALVIVHNLLKLDLRVDPDTQIYNALMLAYIGCDEARHALEFWNELVTTREGPDRKSMLIALWACQNAPFGERKAPEVWEKIESMNLKIDPELVRSYVGALAGHGNIEEGVAVLEMANEKYGIQPDMNM
jgi:hypothetical protein